MIQHAKLNAAKAKWQRDEQTALDLFVTAGWGVEGEAVSGESYGRSGLGKRESLSFKQLFQHHTVAFPCR